MNDFRWIAQEPSLYKASLCALVAYSLWQVMSRDEYLTHQFFQPQRDHKHGRALLV
ncbi:Uncharacterised protein [Legionella oakridgensis]|nr:hypothetical protein LLB_2125 [Legionella longbeachae D-4968]VEE04104.1 Uncharacterised protein [Legionella oakridgensis]